MPRGSMPRLAALLGVAVAVLGALHWWKPFVTQQRLVVTSTPSPGAIAAAADIPLDPGSRICVGPAPIDRAMARAQVTLSAPRAQRARLAVEANAPGYGTRRSLEVDLGPQPKTILTPIASPAHDAVGSICLYNSGRSRIAVTGTDNPVWIGLARTTVDGRELTGRAVALSLLEARPRSILDRLGTIVRRAAHFTGGAMPFWLAWLLTVMLVIGTPLVIFATYWATLRAGEPE
jgi:hypothetical protein